MFFSDATGFFLSIEGDFDASQLVRLVENPDDFKLQPASFLRRALYGVKLREERNPPFELPVKARQYFYRIIPDARVWEQFKKEPSGVVHFESPEKSSFRITLYATLAVPL